MVKIHLVTGNKGNIGKSVWASGIIECYRHHQKPLVTIDGDRDSKTLRSTYSGCIILMLSDDPIMAGQPDIIMQLACEESKKEAGKAADILIDLPAGGEKSINEWIEECGLDDNSVDGFDATFIKWWVCDSDPDSIKLFENSVKKYPAIKHVFLKNMGRSRDFQWEAFDNSKALKSLCKKHSIPVVKIPVLTPKVINLLREEGISMNQAVEDLEHKKVDISTRLRVRSWLVRTRPLIESEILESEILESEISLAIEKQVKQDQKAQASA